MAHDTLQIEKARYTTFVAKWNQGDFAGQRYGQAFYNFMALHKLSDQAALGNLYELDGPKARHFVKQHFLFV